MDPQTQYILDCSVELLDLAPDAHYAIIMNVIPGYRPDKVIDAFDQEPRMGDIRSQNLSLARCFEQDYDAAYDKLPQAAKGAVLIAGMMEVSNHLQELSKELSGKTVKSFIHNNDLFKKLPPMHRHAWSLGGLELDDGEGDERPRNQLSTLNIHQEEDLIHPANFNAILNDERLAHWIERVELMGRRFMALENFDIKDSIDWMQKQFRQRSPERYALTDYSYQKSELKNRKKLLKKASKALQKGMNVFKSFFGQETLKAFLSGDGFTVDGDYFNYHISRSNIDMVRHTLDPNRVHIPYKLELLDKNNGLVLGEGCILFENTPVIDQLIAIMLHLQHGEEQELLTTMNIFNKSDGFHHYIEDIPFLYDRYGKTYRPLNIEKPRKSSQKENELLSFIDRMQAKSYKHAQEHLKQYLRVSQPVANLMWSGNLSFHQLLDAHDDLELFRQLSAPINKVAKQTRQLVENKKNKHLASPGLG